jgi:hypothetical protein
MDFILTHLETAKQQATHVQASYYKACVNLGWSKLDQYYAITDLNPAYIMSVFYCSCGEHSQSAYKNDRLMLSI